MTANRKLAWAQLVSLTAMHFCVDMFSGTMAGFLPVLREKFALSIGLGVTLLTLTGFTCNTFQIVAGGLRKHATTLFFIPLGLLLVLAIPAIGLVPPGAHAFAWLCLLVAIAGVGVACVHPEGLRGVCHIQPDALSPGTATTVFMLAGFLGYASGPLVGGALVERFDSIHAIWLLAPLLPLVLLGLRLSHVRLAVQPAAAAPAAAVPAPATRLTFMQIMLLATLLNTGCTAIQGLLPSYLHSYGHSLKYGGTSALLFGLGSACGTLLINALRKHWGPLRCIYGGLLLGLPLCTLYLLLVNHEGIRILLFFSGLTLGAGFPQLVVLSRTAAKGPSLGLRMGLIVGGSWGLAGILFLLIGFLADLIGLKLAMYSVPAAFAAALLTLDRWRRQPPPAPVSPAAP